MAEWVAGMAHGQRSRKLCMSLRAASFPKCDQRPAARSHVGPLMTVQFSLALWPLVRLPTFRGQFQTGTMTLGGLCMKRKERRHHTREFKLEAVRLAALGDKTKAKIARELGIRVNQLRQWRLDFEEEERNGVPKQESATAEKDVKALRRENARLREENKLLRKAAITSRRRRDEARLHRKPAWASSVNTLCRLLRISTSGYYAARSRPSSAREERQSSLTTKIREVHSASRETYGAPRVHTELSVQGSRAVVAWWLSLCAERRSCLGRSGTSESAPTRAVRRKCDRTCYRVASRRSGPMLVGSAT